MAPTSGHAATSPGPEGLAKNAGSAWMNRGRHGPRLCWNLSTDGGAIRPATIVNGCERYCVLFAPRVHATPAGSTGGGPAGGLRPAVGAVILRGRVRMAVPHPLPRELWDCLVLSGWRNLPVKNDRRKGLRLPEGALKELIDTPSQERNQAHSRILEQAQ